MEQNNYCQGIIYYLTLTTLTTLWETEEGDLSDGVLCYKKEHNVGHPCIIVIVIIVVIVMPFFIIITVAVDNTLLMLIYHTQNI